MKAHEASIQVLDNEARLEVRPGGRAYATALRALEETLDEHLVRLRCAHLCVNGMKGSFFIANVDQLIAKLRLGFVAHPTDKGNPSRRPDRAASWHALRAKHARDPERGEPECPEQALCVIPALPRAL